MSARRVSRRQAVKSIAGAAGGSILLASTPLAFAESGGFVTTFTAPRPDLKILAVTDLHFFWRTAGHDVLTIDVLRRLVKRFTPDLLVVDGDSWNNHLLKISDYMCDFTCDKLSSLGLPWAFVRGNHDLAADFGRCEERLHQAPHSLYPEGRHNANYRIDVKSPAGDTALRLLVLNNAAPDMGFTGKVIAKLRAEIDLIQTQPDPGAPILLFCHIPLPAFKDLVAQGLARGVMFEKVCDEGGSPDSLAAVRDTGLVKAVFCGHDHVNCYRGIMDGVHLEYLRATGLGGYGASKVEKGGTIITVPLDGSGSFTSESVLPSGEIVPFDTAPRLVTEN